MQCLPGLDLLDGITGAGGADIVVFPIDFDGLDLLPLADQALDLLDDPGQLVGRGHTWCGGGSQPARLQGLDGLPGFLQVHPVDSPVFLDGLQQIPPLGQPADLIQRRRGRGGAFYQAARQDGDVPAELAAQDRAGPIVIQWSTAGRAIEGSGGGVRHQWTVISVQ